jgi:phosphoenolpyruvate synthase/pyruvate phosphate dikinase
VQVRAFTILGKFEQAQAELVGKAVVLADGKAGTDIVAFDFDERDPGMLKMLTIAIEGAKRNHRHVGICGEAPATYPEIARFLTGLGIDSISVNPSSILRTMEIVRQAEQVTADSPAVAG